MSISRFTNLCTPSYVYLIISLLFLIIVSVQNIGNINTFCLGSYSCNVTSITTIFLIKMIYIIFWTWVLNLMCNTGAAWFAWLLVLLPFIVLFFLYFYQ